MAMLVWAMMGIALWHFTVFVPDRFWGGIIGAFLGALFGAIIIGLAVNGFTVPGQDDTTIASALEAVPGAHRGHRGRVLPRRPPGQRSLGLRARPAPAGAGCDRDLERVAGGVDLVDDQAVVGGVAERLPGALRRAQVGERVAECDAGRVGRRARALGLVEQLELVAQREQLPAQAAPGLDESMGAPEARFSGLHSSCVGADAPPAHRVCARSPARGRSVLPRP